MAASGIFDLGLLKDRNQLSYCALFRKRVWQEVGGYNPNMVYGYEDWDFWVSCAEKGFRGKRIPEPLFKYRVKKESMYTSAKRHEAELRAQMILNHPSVYRAEEVEAARALLENAGQAKGDGRGQPLVSVIIPTYNRPEQLKRAVASVLKQSFRDFEIVVVNDGGEPVERQLRKLDGEGKITYVNHGRNRGLAAARNTGLRLARGKYVAYLDDDDEFYPDHLDTLVRAAEETGAKVVYSDAHRILEQKSRNGWKEVERRVLYSSEFSRDLLLVQNLAPVQCFLHERSCVQEVGEFDEEFNTHEDWDFWIRLSQKYPFHHVRKVTSAFRQRISGDNMTVSRLPDFLRTTRLIYDRYPLPEGRPELAEARRRKLVFLQREIRKSQRKLSASVVIVTYNSAGEIRRCVNALLPTLKETDEVILIDNASQDGTREILAELEKEHFQVRTILNRKNLGFSAAANQGIRASEKDLVVLLNPDVVVTPGWLEKVAVHFDGETGAVGPVSNIAAQLQNVAFYLPQEDQSRPLDVAALSEKIEARFSGQARETKLLTGFCLALHKKAIEKVGLLDEQLFLGNEDLDYSLRLREAGFKMKIALDTFVYHEAQRSFRTLPEEQKRAWMQESLDRFYAKLEKKYGAGKVPPSTELWGVDILGVPSKFLQGEHVRPLAGAKDKGEFRNLRVALIYDNRVRPDTTGEYCKRALQTLCKVEHFLPEEALELQPGSHDLYLFIDDGLRYTIPYHLRPNAWWAIDTHLQYAYDLEKARQFDVVFTAQRDGAARMKRDGIPSVFWLPLAADPEVHGKRTVEKRYDVAFVGHSFPGRREAFLQAVREHFPNSFIGTAPHQKMAEIYSSAKIVFNISLRDDVNMRVFEGVCSGSLLVTDDLADNGLEELFRSGEHLITYRTPEEAVEKIRYYLDHPEERERIAAQGRKHLLSRHTYRHRMAALLQKVFDEKLAAGAEDHEEELTSIILVTRNGLEVTRRCLESIRKHTSRPYEVIVVDNGSTDGTPEFLQQQKDVRVILNRENRGFAAANNQGIQMARGRYIVLLNNDTVVTPGWLEGLQRAANLSPQVGLVGPVTNFVYQPSQLVETGYRSLEEMEPFALQWREKNRNQYQTTVKLVGFCLLIKREVVEKVGLLDEKFGLGNFEDDDYCIRARLAGFDLIIAREVFIHHEGSYSFRKNKVDYRANMRKNLEYFKQKWRDVLEFRGERYFLKEDLKQLCAAEVYRSEKAFAQGKLDEALQHARKALSWDAESPQAHNNLGVILWQQGKRAEARRHLLRALELAPDFEEAFENLLGTNPGEKELARLVQVLKQRGAESTGRLFRLGTAARERGLEQIARETLQALREVAGDSLEAGLLEAVLAWQRGLAEEAFARLDSLSRRWPQHPELIRHYALFSFQLGYTQEAIALLEEFLKRHKEPGLERLLAEMREAQKQPQPEAEPV